MGRGKAIARAILACAASTLLIGVACNRVSGSGRVVTSPVPVTTFSHIQVSSVFDVSISNGAQEKVTLRVDDNLVDHLDVGVSDDMLKLGLKPRISVHNATLHADVIARGLSSIQVSGSSKVHLAREFTVDSLDVALSGASVIDGSLACGSCNVELSGASSAKLLGSVEILVLGASGASQVEARDLQTRDLTVRLSGASDAIVWPTDTISADVSGASSLRFRGSPRFIRKDVSGASSIEQL